MHCTVSAFSVLPWQKRKTDRFFQFNFALFFFTNFKFVHQAGENIFKNSPLNIDSVLDFRYLLICLHLTLIMDGLVPETFWALDLPRICWIVA